MPRCAAIPRISIRLEPAGEHCKDNQRRHPEREAEREEKGAQDLSESSASPPDFSAEAELRPFRESPCALVLLVAFQRLAAHCLAFLVHRRTLKLTLVAFLVHSLTLETDTGGPAGFSKLTP